MSSTDIYYVYAYLRSKNSKTASAGSPYYIGKGKGNRAFVRHHGKIPDRDHIIVLIKNISHHHSVEIEKALISYYGRKDLGSGILINKTDGGDGLHNPSPETRKLMSEAKMSESAETRLKRSIAAKNRPRRPISEETKRKISEANLGKKRTAESKKLMSDKKIGRRLSEEHKLKISINSKKPKGRQKRVVCPNCGQTVSASAMTKFHGDKCSTSSHKD